MNYIIELTRLQFAKMSKYARQFTPHVDIEALSESGLEEDRDHVGIAH